MLHRQSSYRNSTHVCQRFAEPSHDLIDYFYCVKTKQIKDGATDPGSGGKTELPGCSAQ